jgi:hypothetical protein
MAGWLISGDEIGYCKSYSGSEKCSNVVSFVAKPSTGVDIDPFVIVTSGSGSATMLSDETEGLGHVGSI